MTDSIIDRQLLNSVFIARISGDLVEKTIFDDLKRVETTKFEIRSKRNDLNYEKLNLSLQGINMNNGKNCVPLQINLKQMYFFFCTLLTSFNKLCFIRLLAASCRPAT